MLSMATGPVFKILCTRVALQGKAHQLAQIPSSRGAKKNVMDPCSTWMKENSADQTSFSGIWPQHNNKPCMRKGPLGCCSCWRDTQKTWSKEMSLPWGFLQLFLSPWGSFDCLMSSHKYSWGSCSSCRWSLWQPWWIFRPAIWSQTSAFINLGVKGKRFYLHSDPRWPEIIRTK